MNEIAAVLSSMRAKGVRIWNEDGKLRYRCTTGKLTDEDIETLRVRKMDIIRFMETSPPVECSSTHKLPSEAAPLAFSQQAWKGLRRFIKHNTRFCVNAIRLSGPLDVDCLKRALSELVKRHEILRVRIIPGENGNEATQAVADNRNCDLEIVSVTGEDAGSKEAEAQRLVEEFVNLPCDVTTDPLFATRLVRIDRRDHVLVVAIDHIIADGASVGIALRDLWIMYLQATRQHPLELPRTPLQFLDYANWEQMTNEKWKAEHGKYWNEKLNGAPRTKIALGHKPTPGERLRVLQARFTIDKEVTDGLRALARREHTTLVMAVLTAYCALVSLWTKTSDITLAFQVAGRNRPEFSNTIGVFASSLFLRVYVDMESTFSELMRHITKEFFVALEHQDSGRNSLAWPEAEYTKTTAFNWHSKIRTESYLTVKENSHEPSRATGDAEAIRMRSFPFNRSALDVKWDDDWNRHVDVMDGDPGAVLSETADGVSGWMLYGASAVAEEVMEKFARSFELIAEAGFKNPKGRIKNFLRER